VRRVAGSLEAVDRKRVEGVDRRQLIDHEHPAARSGNPGELGDDEFGPPHVMERPERAGEIEGGILERQARCIGLDELGVGGSAPPRELEQLGDTIDADDLAHERRPRA